MSSELYTQAKPQIDQLIEYYRATSNVEAYLADCYTKPDVTHVKVISVFTNFIASVVEVLNRFGTQSPTNPTGPTDTAKRDAAIAAGLEFYRKVLYPALVAAVGSPVLVNLVIGPLLERILPGVIGALYDLLANVIGRNGTPVPPTGEPLPPNWTPY